MRKLVARLHSRCHRHSGTVASLIWAFAVAASLDHRTQQMDGPRAAKMIKAAVGE